MAAPRSSGRRGGGPTVLAGAEVWRTTAEAVKRARVVRAAIAYLGTGATRLLPLRKGSTLVVDMSLRAVRSGATNPHEVEKLLKRGVRVCTRASLHAKVVVTERVAIVGSANASRHSRDHLDEVALAVRDPQVRRQLASVVESYGAEPVRPEYLKLCKKEYRPPRANSAGGPQVTRAESRPKLWFLGGLSRLRLSQAELEAIRPLEQEAEKHLKAPAGAEVTWIRYRRRSKMFQQIEPGQWAISCIREGSGRVVEAPGQLIQKRLRRSGRGTPYAFLFLEVPLNAQSVSLGAFRRRVRTVVPELDSPGPRTRPISDQRAADEILRLWTPSGKWRR